MSRIKFDETERRLRDNFEAARADETPLKRGARESGFYSRALAVLMRHVYRVAQQNGDLALAVLREREGRVYRNTTPFHAMLRLVLLDERDRRRIPKLVAVMQHAADYQIHWRFFTIFRQLTGDYEDIKELVRSHDVEAHEVWAKYLRHNPRKRVPK